MYEITEGLMEKFRSYFTEGPANECWEFHGSREGDITDFARFFYNGVELNGCKLSLQYYKGYYNPNKFVKRTCRNRHCVNPGHLYQDEDDLEEINRENDEFLDFLMNS